MGKIISLIHMSLDGYMADQDGQINWIKMDEEVAGYVAELTHGASGTIYGRVTYQLMDPYWPNVLKNPEAYPKWQVDYAVWVNEALKLVISKTLAGVSWNNMRVISENVVEEIGKIKREAKDNLLLLASATLVNTLLPAGLIDEICVTVNPIVLGGGKEFFKPMRSRAPLKLLETRKFKTGVMGLRYQVMI
jgi:dihydrofolate reductase